MITTSSSTINNSSSSSRRGPSLKINVDDLNDRRTSSPRSSSSSKTANMSSRILQQQQQLQRNEQYARAQDEARDILEDDPHETGLGIASAEGGDTRARDYHQYEGEEDVMMHQYSQHGSSSSLRYVDEDGQGGHHGDEEHDEEPEEGEEELDDSGSFSDSLSSSPSIPDEDIDFTLVYALHTFLATVDGQASVVKGDKLLLLDDSNSYWWLVRVLKTQAVGYIPAENIETPWERLARLNKHLNVDLTTATQQDFVSGPSSTQAQFRFQTRIPPSQQPHPHMSQHPSAKGVIASPSHKDHPRNISPPPQIERNGNKRKTVLFTAPTYYEHSANGESEGDEYDDEYGSQDGEPHEHDVHDGEEGEEEHEGERTEGDQAFDDRHDDEGEESEFSDDALNEEGGVHSTLGTGAERSGVITAGSLVAAQHVAHEGSRGEIGQIDENTAPINGIQNEPPVAVTKQVGTPAHKRTLSPHDLGNYEPEVVGAQMRALNGASNRDAVREASDMAQRSPIVEASNGEGDRARDSVVSGEGELTAAVVDDPFARSPDVSAGSIKGREVNLRAFGADGPTKKLTATPPIVRDPSFDINDPFGDLQTSKTSSPRAASPVRVRGVEVVNPNDPRYNRLIGPAKRLHDDYSNSNSPSSPSQADYGRNSVSRDGDASMTSFDTTSSYVGASEEGGNQNGTSTNAQSARATTPNSVNSVASGSTAGKSTKLAKKGSKEGRDSIDGEENGSSGKKRKSGGGILGLFRKKDKKKKNTGANKGDVDDDLDGRSSGESNRISSPTMSGSPRLRDQSNGQDNRRTSQTAETLFSTDATLRQQQLEAKQAMYHQYGVQRGPGDLSNTMTPRSGPSSVALSPNSSSQSASATPMRMRPGSLIGSPSIPGLDVPVLSVLRIFAGEHVEAEATFKTVLLNRSTTTRDLVKQAMQRFRLAGDAEIDEYHLVVRELGGEERILGDDVRPLAVFESLSEQTEQGFVVPSVKRSSVGSINSIQSNLSLNPAITRLGMNDWSDDSAVKFYLHRRLPEYDAASLAAQDPEDSSTSSTRDAQNSHSLPPPISVSGPVSNMLSAESSPAAASPSFRFAVKVVIHPQDLPENVVFDPQSNAIIPRSVLADRHQRPIPDSDPILPDVRERIVFFPRNVSVSEVIEAGLDRFGIVDGVVDGGDEVEDRVSKRRSVTRVKYTLAVLKDGQEHQLNSSGKLIDAYSTAPLLRPYDRTSKEFRRRSVDATLILGSQQDVQPTDPVFVLRRAAHRGPASRAAAGPIPNTIDELEERQQRRAFAEQQTAIDPISASQAAATMQQARAMLSARQNDEQGVDIAIPDRGTVRSVRSSGNRVRYSFIGPNGQTTDISDLVDSEFAAAPSTSDTLHPNDRSASRLTNATSTDAESFVTAHEGASLYSSSSGQSTSTLNASVATESDEDGDAVKALRSTDINIGPASPALSNTSSTMTNVPTITRSLGAASALRQAAAAGQSPRLGSLSPASPTSPTHDDLLQGAFGSRRAMSPAFNESLQERLDRVLAKVKQDKLKGRASPALRPPSWASEHTRASGTSTPTVRAASPSQSASGRRSPGSTTGGSPSIDQIVRGTGSNGGFAPRSSSRASGHEKTLSSSSHRSDTTELASASTPVTSSGGHGPSRAPSAATSRNRGPPQFVDDFGLDTMLAIVNGQSKPPPRKSSLKPQSRAEQALFGPSLRDLDLSPEIRKAYEPQTRRLDELEARLDALMLRLNVSTPSPSLKNQSSSPKTSTPSHPYPAAPANIS